jgi:demethylmenaquinone methyltransferase/2-methoxy-6-polyprenyl-1,4-benzoquinol methylase
MLREGERSLDRAGLTARTSLVLGRGEQLPFPDASFDALTFTYLLRYVADPAATLRELARVVRPGGPIASVEFAVPPHALWRLAWRCYTRAVLPLAGLVTGGKAWFDVGRFLGPSIEAHDDTYPLEWLLGAWADAGITDVAHRRMSLGGGLVVWGTRA